MCEQALVHALDKAGYLAVPVLVEEQAFYSRQVPRCTGGPKHSYSLTRALVAAGVPGRRSPH